MAAVVVPAGSGTGLVAAGPGTGGAHVQADAAADGQPGSDGCQLQHAPPWIRTTRPFPDLRPGTGRGPGLPDSP